jgi:UDP-N-acetylmuramyl pentapeptide phosphotransferase/UDP-N-acetylglucosamine-1-phosphate transferase
VARRAGRSGSRSSFARRLLAAGTGALAARQALGAVNSAVAPAMLARTNYRGRTVTLAGGPALAAGATAAAAAGATDPRTRAAVLVAGLGAGTVGGYDDQVGMRPEQKAKGFRGHLAALAQGRVTSGLVKIAGVGASALIASALLGTPAGRPRKIGTTSRKLWPQRVPVTTISGKLCHIALGAGVIAGTANLVNLLDLRPGRAIKAGLLVGAPLAAGSDAAGGIAAGTVGAAAALLPADLNEEIMLGDAGANALGALLGFALAARTGTVGRAVLLAGLAALTATSEKVSFTQVIQRTPVLRDLDALGRRAD